MKNERGSETEREEEERDWSKQKSKRCRMSVRRVRMTGVIMILNASCPQPAPKEIKLKRNSHNKPPLLQLIQSILLLHPILEGNKKRRITYQFQGMEKVCAGAGRESGVVVSSTSGGLDVQRWCCHLESL
jgi:hypothetical protein